MSRRIGSPVLLLATALLCACAGEGTPFEPLSGGLSVPVTLETTFGGPTDMLPRLEITAVGGAAKIEWDVASPPCLDAEASALLAGQVIEVRIHRSADALALCVAGTVAYHYVARVAVPGPGAFEIRLVDDLLGPPLRPIGRATVSLLPAP